MTAVTAWVVLLDQPESVGTLLTRGLPEAERDAARRRVVARGALRDVVARELGTRASDVQVSRECQRCGHPTHGKPWIVDAPELSFSLSHSGRWAIVAIARDATVGADLEVVRARRRLERLAARVLSDSELEQWRATPPPARPVLFVELWTAKEAFLKATGRGISGSLREITPPVDGWRTLPLHGSEWVAHVAIDRAWELEVAEWQPT
jgi:4'-phosphopantetheinyl transferase